MSLSRCGRAGRILAPIPTCPRQFALERGGLNGGKLAHLQVVSTDHCPFCFEDQTVLGKDNFTKIPNGGPGVENRLQLLYHHGVNQGRLTLNRGVEVVATTPAKIFGLYPRKGVL